MTTSALKVSPVVIPFLRVITSSWFIVIVQPRGRVASGCIVFRRRGCRRDRRSWRWRPWHSCCLRRVVGLPKCFPVVVVFRLTLIGRSVLVTGVDSWRLRRGTVRWLLLPIMKVLTPRRPRIECRMSPLVRVTVTLILSFIALILTFGMTVLTLLRITVHTVAVPFKFKLFMTVFALIHPIFLT